CLPGPAVHTQLRTAPDWFVSAGLWPVTDLGPWWQVPDHGLRPIASDGSDWRAGGTKEGRRAAIADRRLAGPPESPPPSLPGEDCRGDVYRQCRDARRACDHSPSSSLGGNLGPQLRR